MTSYNTVIVNLLAALNRNQDKSVTEKMRYAGANTGNIIFTEALKEQLNYTEEIWINPQALKKISKPSVIIPSANFIAPGNDSLMEALQRFLDNTQCPVTMAGLGAQARLETTPKEVVSKLSDLQINVFKKISERTKTIGVRGEFSAECLNLIGIKNIRIIGCPSFYFRRGNHSFRLKIPSMKCPQMTITPGHRKECKLLELGIRSDSFWIMQMMTELPAIAFEQTNWDLSVANSIRHTFSGSHFSSKKIWSYMKQKAKIFFNKSSWDDFYQKNDISFAFGSRFHGNIQAFRNAVPSLWVVHDTRTAELVKTLYLPSINYEQLKKIKFPQELLEYCDYREYETHYDELYTQYLNFLSENNLEYKKELL